MTRRVGFIFLGPAAHIAHAATIAFELDAMPGYEATALVSSPIHAETVDRLACQYGRGCRIESLGAGPLHRLLRLFKQRTHPRVRYVLAHNRQRLEAFDALVLTDAHPLPTGPRRPRLVLAGHGAGLRAHGRYPGMAQFDLFLLPGRLKAERLRQMGYVDERRSRIIGYPKFDLATPVGQRMRLFGNDRPVVLYNPHFNTRESSWPRWGRRVLDFFLAHREYNLIFAPHALLFAHLRPRLAPAYLQAPNIHVDVDSPALIDMSYTSLADIYLGDVSSQAYEFVGHRLRPCVFLDPHRRRWDAQPNLAMWRMGEVVQAFSRLPEALRTAHERFGQHRAEQRRLVTAAFDVGTVPAGVRGARAVAELLGEPPPERRNGYKHAIGPPEPTCAPH
jgi:hypothetical protein